MSFKKESRNKTSGYIETHYLTFPGHIIHIFFNTIQARSIDAVRGPTLNYERELSLYIPHMFRVYMTRDLAHLQLADLQGEIRPICRT